VLRRLKGEVDAYVRTRTSRSLYELRHASVVALLVTRHALENDEEPRYPPPRRRRGGKHERDDGTDRQRLMIPIPR